MAENPRNFLSSKSPALSIIVGGKHDEKEPEHEEHGDSAGYSENGPATCSKCSYFDRGQCSEEHMLNDPESKKDGDKVTVNGDTGWCHYFDSNEGPRAKDAEMEAGESEDKEHNYPARYY